MDQPLPFGASPAWWHQVLDGLAELGTDREDHVRVEMRGGPPRKGHPHRLRVIFGEAATGAGGRHHERAEMLGERTKRRSRFLATVHAVTGEDQGEAGGDEQPRGRIEGGRVGGTGCRAVRGGLEDRDVRLIDGLSEHIGRNLEEGRSGATGERGPERFPYELGDSASLLDRGRELRHRPKDFDLRPELEPTAAQGVHAAPHACCVPIASTGTPSIDAHTSPGTMLATPGPPAAATTAICPVVRAHVSAMCTPALSCRGPTMRIPATSALRNMRD